MNLETAIDYLTNTKKRKVSEIGKAIDVLYQEYHSYENISKKLGKSSKFLSKIHHIFKLPEGVKILKEPSEIVVSVLPPEKVEEELEKPIEEKVEEVEEAEEKPVSAEAPADKEEKEEKEEGKEEKKGEKKTEKKKEKR